MPIGVFEGMYVRRWNVRNSSGGSEEVKEAFGNKKSCY
jgi:hypothetical protein